MAASVASSSETVRDGAGGTGRGKAPARTALITSVSGSKSGVSASTDLAALLQSDWVPAARRGKVLRAAAARSAPASSPRFDEARALASEARRNDFRSKGGC